ncbi:hypothetical protein ACMDB5_03950 [Flavobacterium sp. W1B]|uniref:hypothetical protein n=1 Tax=Flavobacterium sp. W1B TaxID=3394146 RepID=UPI0039BC55ED
MKLTEPQITLIEETLVLNGLNYDDIKLEVTDHIASEIEALMEDNTHSFEENLKIVFEKWAVQLKPTTYGLWLGYAYSGPKMVMDKMANFTKSELKWGLLLAFFSTLIILLLYKIINNVDFLLVLDAMLKKLLIVVILTNIYFRITLFKTKVKTVYSTLFNRRFYITLLFSIQIAFNIFRIVPLNKSLEVKVLTLVLLLIFVMYCINSLRFLHKHFKVEKKLSPSIS